MRRKVFIYDTSKGYSRLISKVYGEVFDITQCKYEKKINQYPIEQNDFAFVIINHRDDILKLIQIRSKVKIIFLGSRIKSIDYSIYNIEGIINLNLFERRKTFLMRLDAKLNELDLIAPIQTLKENENENS